MLNASTVLLKINNYEPPALKTFKVERNKLWTNAGRDMDGGLHADSLGIYPKLNLEFTYSTAAEMQAIMALLDLDSFTVAWYDQVSDTIKTGEYYAGDHSYSIFRKDIALYDPFNVNLIPYRRMS
jgi:hypothetical protein